MMEDVPHSKDFAVVLGGSQGLGLATVRKLLMEGIPVIAIHRDMRKDMKQIAVEFDSLSRREHPLLQHP